MVAVLGSAKGGTVGKGFPLSSTVLRTSIDSILFEEQGDLAQS